MSHAVRVAIVRERGCEDIPLPAYETEHAAGMDLRAALPAGTILSIAPGDRALLPTGLRIAVPPGYEAQVRPRSGLAVNHGVTVLNAPGTVDSDYRGELKVIVINHGAREFTVTRGMRVAQLVFARVAAPEFIPVETLSTTGRGAGGFGSTGH